MGSGELARTPFIPNSLFSLPFPPLSLSPSLPLSLSPFLPFSLSPSLPVPYKLTTAARQSRDFFRIGKYAYAFNLS